MNQASTIEQQVMTAITSGHVVMRDRGYFQWRRGIQVAGLVLLGGFVLWLGSFLLYSLDRTGQLYLPVFGLDGWKLLATTFPWWPTVLLALTAVCFGYFLRQNTHLYRLTAGLTTVLVFFGAGTGAYALYQTPLHASVQAAAEQQHLPLVEPLYRSMTDIVPKQTYTGHIQQVTSQGYVIVNSQQQSVEVTQTKVPIIESQVQSPLHSEERVLIIGHQQENGSVVAEKIRRIPESRSRAVKKAQSKASSQHQELTNAEPADRPTTPSQAKAAEKSRGH